jgi:hypothetical protein
VSKGRVLLLCALGLLLVLSTRFLAHAQPAAVPASAPTAASTPAVPAALAHTGTPHATPSVTHTGTDDAAIPPAKVGTGWLQAADRFTRAYLHTGVPATTWHAAVRPLCTAHLAAGLAYTDPAKVPHGRVRSVFPALAFDTGGGTHLAVTVVAAGRGWRVAQVDEG